MLGWFSFFTCSIGNQQFSVGLVDQVFQPTQNPVELVENDGYHNHGNYKIPLLEFRRLFRSQCGGGNCGWEGKNLCGVVLGVKGTMVNARGERRRKI